MKYEKLAEQFIKEKRFEKNSYAYEKTLDFVRWLDRQEDKNWSISKDKVVLDGVEFYPKDRQEDKKCECSNRVVMPKGEYHPNCPLFVMKQEDKKKVNPLRGSEIERLKELGLDDTARKIEEIIRALNKN